MKKTSKNYKTEQATKRIMKTGLTVIIIVLVVISCKQNTGIPIHTNTASTLAKPTSSSQKQTYLAATPEPFNDFLRKFSTDSVFRSERIKFPLEGYNSEDETHVIEISKDSIKYLWERKLLNYYLRQKYDGDDYKKKVKVVGAKATATTYIEGSGFDVTSEYSLINGKWYLTFYFYRNE